MTRYIEEFLYRGRAPGSPDSAAFQITIAQIIEDPFDPAATVIQRRTMTIQQAAAAGFSPPQILNTLNLALLQERDELLVHLAELEEQLETLTPQSPTSLEEGAT